MEKIVRPFLVFLWLACSIAAPLLICGGGRLVVGDSACVIWALSFCFDLCACQIKALMFPPFSFSEFLFFVCFWSWFPQLPVLFLGLVYKFFFAMLW